MIFYSSTLLLRDFCTIHATRRQSLETLVTDKGTIWISPGLLAIVNRSWVLRVLSVPETPDETSATMQLINKGEAIKEEKGRR